MQQSLSISGVGEDKGYITHTISHAVKPLAVIVVVAVLYGMGARDTVCGHLLTETHV